MRLLDQIVRSQPEITATDTFGRKHRMTGLGAKAHLIEDCSLRYVLDWEASQQCFALVRSDTGLIMPENELLRLPAQRFWIEWLPEQVEGRRSDGRLGALVEADETGRRGLVTGFWTNDNGQADLTIVATQFDLDAVLRPPVGSHTALKVRHATLTHMNGLLDHVLFHLDPTWEPFVRAQHRERFGSSVQSLAEAAWFNLPVVLAFAAMLNSRSVLDERPADLSRLNRARAKKGRHALLDHIEVRMSIGSRADPAYRSGDGYRAPPRLHHVRGHLVHRSGKTFWRASHLRGDHDRAILSKTVAVTARRGPHAALERASVGQAANA